MPTLTKMGKKMGYKISPEPEYLLSYSLFKALTDKEAKRLQFAKCPTCKKLTSYRMIALNNSPLACKSCRAPIPIERHEDSPWSKK